MAESLPHSYQQITWSLHTLIFYTSVRWILCILWFLLAGLALQVDSPSSGSSFRTSGRSPTSGWSPLRTPGWFLLQDSLPFAIHLSSVGADLDENGPPVMNQIARGGYSLTPPEGGTTRVPLASGLRSQTPPSSSTLPGRFEPPTPRPCVGTEMGTRTCNNLTSMGIKPLDQIDRATATEKSAEDVVGPPNA